MKALNSLKDVNKAVGYTSCKLVVIRFGDQEDPLCIDMDSVLHRISLALSNYAEIYTCERSCVKELVDIMELDSPVNVMCFFNRRHIKIDCSSGDINKINFFIGNDDMLTELFTLAYKTGVRNKGMVVSPFKLDELKDTNN